MMSFLLCYNDIKEKVQSDMHLCIDDTLCTERLIPSMMITSSSKVLIQFLKGELLG